MIVTPTQSKSIDFKVKDASGKMINADQMPTAVIYVEGDPTAIPVDVSATAGDGNYKASWSHEGLTLGHTLRVRAKALIAEEPFEANVFEATVWTVDGAGPDARKLTIQAHTGASPVSGLQVRIGLRTLTTMTDGADAINLNPGTYTARIIPPPLFAPVDDIEITIAGDDVTLPIAVQSIAVPPPDPGTICRVTLRVADESDAPWVGINVYATLDSGPAVGDTIHANRTEPGVTDSDGIVSLDRLQGQTYLFTICRPDGTEISIRRRLPDQPNATLSVTVPV